MIHWLRELAAFSEDLGSITSIHMVTHNPLLLQFQGIWYPIFVSVGTWHTCGTQVYTEAEHPST